VAVLESASGATRRHERRGALASAIVSVDYDHEVYLGGRSRHRGREGGCPARGTLDVVALSPPRPGGRGRAGAGRGRRVVNATAESARAGAPVSPSAPAGAFDLETPSAATSAFAPSRSAPARQPARGDPAPRGGEAAGLASTCGGCRGRSRRRAGPVACSGSRPPPLLLDGATTRPARAASRAPPARAAARAPFRRDVGQGPHGHGEHALPARREVVLTRPRIDRAATPSELARRAGRLAARAHREPSVARALALAAVSPRHGETTTVVVAGSLYLVGRSPRSWSGKGGGAELRRQRLAPPSRRRRNVASLSGESHSPGPRRARGGDPRGRDEGLR